MDFPCSLLFNLTKNTNFMLNIFLLKIKINKCKITYPHFFLNHGVSSEIYKKDLNIYWGL